MALVQILSAILILSQAVTSASLDMMTPGDFQEVRSLRDQEPAAGRNKEVFLDDLDTALDLKDPDLVAVLLGSRHQVYIPEELVTHICLRKLVFNFDQVLFKYRVKCPNLETGDVNVRCYLGNLAVHDAVLLTRNATLRKIHAMCQLWWKLGIQEGKLSGRKDAEMGRCLSKLVSKSCDVESFIQTALNV